MRYVFWQNMASPHQAPMLRALAAGADAKVELLVQVAIPPERARLGWSVPDFGGVELIVAPGPDEVGRRVRSAPGDSVHVFSGLGAYPLVRAALREAVRTPALLGIMSEAGDWRGWRGALRLSRARLEARRFGRQVGFVLAMGALGERWFRRTGFPAERIHPFGYFVDAPGADGGPDERPAEDPTPELVFIGECVPRKGGDLLLRALRELAGLPWRLTVVGDGPERARWQELAADLGISARVRMAGAQPNATAMEILDRSDLLVLPSRWDGWGAVVNEALVRGVPVVCSSYCGAADLVAGPDRGAVFPAGSVGGLREALSAMIGRGKRGPERTRRISEWSARIAGPVAAEYFRAVVAAAASASPSPRAPWRESV